MPPKSPPRFPGGFGPFGILTDEEKSNKPKITFALLKRIFSYLLPYWKQMILVLIAILLASVCSVYPSILTGKIIDEGLYGRNLGILIKLILLCFGVIIASNLISVGESYLNTWIAQHITFDMRNRMFRHLQTMSQRFFTTNNQGDIITRMTSDIAGVQMTITNTLTTIISNIITLVVALVAMYRMNWILATVAILIVPLFSLPTKTVGKRRWKLTQKAQECNDEINGILNETLSVSGQMLVKLFTNEEYEYNRYYNANHQMIKLNIRENMTGQGFRVVMSILTNIGPMMLYFVGGLLMIKGGADLTVGDITVMVTLLSRIYMPVNSLMNLQVDIIRSMALFTRIFSYFDMPTEVQNSPNPIKPEKLSGHIVFDDVSFYYEEGQPVLDHVSFEVPEGKTVAIVGPSGAGKSTLINLIPRLYDVTGGRILFDGYDLRELDLSLLRRNVGVVTQDTYLFNGTIRDNLLYAKHDATDEEIEEACKKANIHDFVMSLPEGYDTVVGNRGLKLSGGEKQRMSIARVMLKNPVVLIFDEATSSLDSISESLIQDAIDPLITGRTSIVIAHRLSTVMAADEILVVSEGKIVERGKHADLVQQGGVYAELYDTQFRRALQDYETRRNGENVSYEGTPGEGWKWQPYKEGMPADGTPMPDFPFPAGFRGTPPFGEGAI
ncbi:MAG: ABC transporter ATP-binding protein [Clostridiales bacterium]|jgi:ATP-binding cassette subfamily B protein|nr:ABC transporter ATP-binding protein [Clostridiales bacterium]